MGEVRQLRPPPPDPRAKRHAALSTVGDLLDAMQGLLNEARSTLWELPAVSAAAQSVAVIEPMIEAARNRVLEAWDGES